MALAPGGLITASLAAQVPGRPGPSQPPAMQTLTVARRAPALSPLLTRLEAALTRLPTS